MTDAYLLLAGDERIEAVAVYVGKQAGAEKAAAALTAKRRGLPPDMVSVRVAPIELVDTCGAVR